MLQAVNALARAAVMNRVVLVLNHVLAAEPQATARLGRHAAKVLKVELARAPAWWPFASAEHFRISPAGLLEWLDTADSGDALTVSIAFDRLQPSMAWAVLRGQGVDALEVQLDGDAGLAADVDWVARECRWDIEADLAKAIGPIAARQLVALARGARAALHKVVASRATGSQPPAPAA